MKKVTKIIIIISVITILVGGIMVGIAAFLGVDGKVYWDKDKNRVVVLDEDDIIRLPKTRIDSFDNISIETSVFDVELIPSDGYYVEYALYAKDKDDIYSVKNGCFEFKSNTSYTFGFDLGAFNHEDDMYIKLYYPEDVEFDSVYIDSSVGDITASGFKAITVDIENSCGDIDINGIAAGTIDLNTSVGEITIRNVSADEITADTSTGDIEFGSSDVFKKGRFETSVGEIDLTFDGNGKTTWYDYRVIAETSVGEISVDGRDQGDEYESDQDKGIIIDCSTSTGDIEIDKK